MHAVTTQKPSYMVYKGCESHTAPARNSVLRPPAPWTKDEDDILRDAIRNGIIRQGMTASETSKRLAIMLPWRTPGAILNRLRTLIYDPTEPVEVDAVKWGDFEAGESSVYGVCYDAVETAACMVLSLIPFGVRFPYPLPLPQIRDALKDTNVDIVNVRNWLKENGYIHSKTTFLHYVESGGKRRTVRAWLFKKGDNHTHIGIGFIHGGLEQELRAALNSRGIPYGDVIITKNNGVTRIVVTAGQPVVTDMPVLVQEEFPDTTPAVHMVMCISALAEAASHRMAIRAANKIAEARRNISA